MINNIGEAKRKNMQGVCKTIEFSDEIVSRFSEEINGMKKGTMHKTAIIIDFNASNGIINYSASIIK